MASALAEARYLFAVSIADEANAVAEASETGVPARSRSRARAASAVKMTADTVRYIRWTEVVSDGVVGVRRK